jgi:sarcosine oxidase
MKIAIVGAGAVGLSSAYHISKRNHQVTLYEQFEIGHDKGSSHGSSRIIRKTYADPYYANLMEEVFPYWLQLQDDSRQIIYHETGLLLFGRPESQFFLDSTRALRQCRIKYEFLGPVEVAKRFGGFHLQPDEVAVFQPQAGYLKADLILNILKQECHNQGVDILENTKVKQIDNGRVDGIKYDAIVICTGAWMTAFVEIPVEVYMQTFAYFEAPVSKDIPVWIDSSNDHFYGFPDYGMGFKVGRHLYGQPLHPESEYNQSDEEAFNAIAKSAQERLGATGEPKKTATCLYTVAPKEDFIIGKLQSESPTYFVSACSGHGFKFSIWIGDLIRKFIEGESQPSDFQRWCWPRTK